MLEKDRQAEALRDASKELAFHESEKEKRAAELIIANRELAFQNEEKEKRGAELVIANQELLYQNEEKEKRAAELVIANQELIYQNEEKEKRAAELVVANRELLYQNVEKEKRAAELVIANQELLYQNIEKEKRAQELAIANEELLFQNQEKGKRAAELAAANKELLAFTFISSHDLQEPLRKIETFAARLLEKETSSLSEKGQDYFRRMGNAAKKMRVLIEDLLAYSHTSNSEMIFENTNLNIIVEEAKKRLEKIILKKSAVLETQKLDYAMINPPQFQQAMTNLIANSLKFSKPGVYPHIVIKSQIARGSELKIDRLSTNTNYCHIVVSDNGMGFDPQYQDRIFEVFQRLLDKEKYEGTGIGLAIVKKIVENHNGIITATGVLDVGATFDIYIPAEVPAYHT